MAAATIDLRNAALGKTSTFPNRPDVISFWATKGWLPVDPQVPVPVYDTVLDQGVGGLFATPGSATSVAARAAFGSSTFAVEIQPGTTGPQKMQAAINAAVAAGGGIVLLGPRTYDWVGTPPTVPANLTGQIVIRGSGRGVTKIALTTTCNRLFDFAKVADGDVFRNVIVEDLTVDAAAIEINKATGHGIIGTAAGGQNLFSGSDISISDIVVRRVVGLNAPLNAGPGAGGTKQFYWINLAPWVDTNGTQRYVERILIEDVDLFGGETGIAIGGWRKGSGATDCANVWTSDIIIRRWRHIITPVPTEQLYGNHIILGARGFGGRAYISDGYGVNCPDVGLEIDSMSDVVVERVVLRDSWHGCFYHTQYNPSAAAMGPQRITYRDCTAQRRNYVPATIQQGTAQGYGWYFSHNPAIAECADIAINDCQWIRRTNDHAVLGSAIWAVTVPHLEIDGFVSDEVVNFTGVAGSQPTSIAIQPEPGFTTYLRMNRVRFKIAGSKVGGVDLVWAALRLRYGQVDFDIENCAVDFGITNAAAANCRAFYLGDEAEQTIVKGTVRRTRLEKSTDTAASLIVVPSMATTTIRERVLVQDCDVRTIDVANATTINHLLVRFAGAANGTGQQNYGGVMILSSPRSANKFPAVPSAVTVTGSPFVFRNIEGYRLKLFVSGAGITNIEWSQDAEATYYSYGSAGGAFDIDSGDYIRITYSGAAPIVTKMTPR